MLVAEIKDQCAEVRAFLLAGKPKAGLLILDSLIAGVEAPQFQTHPVMGVIYILKAEALQCLDVNNLDQADYLAKALAVSKEHLVDDFENVAPILLNIVRHCVRGNQSEKARAAADLLLSGCNHYYGQEHPRLFQLQRWIEEAGCA